MSMPRSRVPVTHIAEIGCEPVQRAVDGSALHTHTHTGVRGEVTIGSLSRLSGTHTQTLGGSRSFAEGSLSRSSPAFRDSLRSPASELLGQSFEFGSTRSRWGRCAVRARF